MNSLEKYYDLHVQIHAVLLADVLEKIWNKCLEIYELNPARFCTAPELAWQATLIKK